VKQQCGSVALKSVVVLQLLIFVGRFSPFLQGINEMFPSPAQDRPCSVHVVGRELLHDDLVQILGFGREDLASWYWIQYSLLRWS